MTLPASGPLAMTDIQTEFGGTNPIGLNEYYAGGGLVPAGTSGTYGAVPSSGALSIQNFYGTSNYIPVYIEELFSTYLYTGNGSTQTITNGIDLAGEGGLVWIKNRATTSGFTFNHFLFDTSRGPLNRLITNNTDSSQGTTGTLTSFNANGFSLGSDSGGNVNYGPGTNTYASWTFREQPKFFDVVTYTGNGVDPRAISHNLGSVPGMIVVKRTNSSGSDWLVYHRSLSTGQLLSLNGTFAAYTTNEFTTTAPTSSVFYVANSDAINGSGNTYVAYLFAHDAGGFGLTGTDNVISCGSFTTDAGGLATVNLGYEPQWVLVKCTSNADNWTMLDNMRGWNMTTQDKFLLANTSAAESEANFGNPTATGFDASFGESRTYIYIAIRRGPMKVPTDGTKVFNTLTYAVINNSTWVPATPNGVQSADGFAPVSMGNAVDAIIVKARDQTDNWAWTPRLTGFTSNNTAVSPSLASNSTAAEVAQAGGVRGSGSTSATGLEVRPVYSSATIVTFPVYLISRAPSFFDEVCYTGNGPGTQVIGHNLTVVPELVINKVRSTTSGWTVFQGSTTALTGFLRLNETSAQGGDTLNVSSTTITVDSTIGFGMNTSGQTYVTYLFASCPGVSKVGSYTGTGTTQQINCGFTAGARFVLIKRTDSTGDWYVWDSARGIVAGNDPYLLLNSTAAEVTSTDYIDTYSAGFEISSTAPAAINASGGTFIFLAIA